MMRRKFLDGTNSKWIKQCEAELVHIDGKFSGYLSAVTALEVKKVIHITLPDGEVDLCAKGHHVLNFLPDGKNWAMSANYDPNWNLIEWYFDITKENGVDETGAPYFDDLYLDYVVTPDNSSVVLDEDELLEAERQGAITKEDVSLAYRTLEELRTGFASNADTLMEFCEECWQKYFSQMRNRY